MAHQNLPHQEPTTDSAVLAIAETVVEVTNKLTCDLDIAAHVCASHDQALLAIVEEVEQLRIANAQLYIRLCHLAPIMQCFNGNAVHASAPA